MLKVSFANSIFKNRYVTLFYYLIIDVIPARQNVKLYAFDCIVTLSKHSMSFCALVVKKSVPLKKVIKYFLKKKSFVQRTDSAHHEIAYRYHNFSVFNLEYYSN